MYTSCSPLRPIMNTQGNLQHDSEVYAWRYRTAIKCPQLLRRGVTAPALQFDVQRQQQQQQHNVNLRHASAPQANATSYQAIMPHLVREQFDVEVVL